MLKQSLLSLSMVLGLSILPAKIAQSAVLNGSFETGNFSNWDTTATGQTTVEDLGFGVTPTQGDYQAVLQTCFYDANSQACDDGQSLSDANTLESFLGLSTDYLSNLGVTEGSAIKQSITVNNGDILTFDWNFLTDEDSANTNYNDFAFFTVNNTLISLANIESTFNIVPSFSHLAKETGYQPFSYTFTSAGTYTLGFGVVDVDREGGGDTSVNSALLVDNVNVEPIPEPFTILGTLTALGFGAKFWSMRRSP
jgi:hypothetical protein